MLGYDLYSSALADILSEPSLSMPITVGFYFTDQTRVSSTTGGENSVVQMLGSLYDSIENDYGALATRLYRAFRPKPLKSTSSWKWRRLCCLPYAIIFELSFLSLLGGICVLTIIEETTAQVKCLDSFTSQQTRLVVIVDGLDSCEQDKVLLVLDAVHMLFSDSLSPFIVILAIDPHAVEVNSRLLKAFQIDFNWYHLASWINITEQWPYRTSWIILYYDMYEDTCEDNMPLKALYDKVRPQIPISKEMEPLLELDKDERKFDIFLTFHRSSLLVTLEEQMICGALQTLNEEACEDVLDEAEVHGDAHRVNPAGAPTSEPVYQMLPENMVINKIYIFHLHV
ncbi:Uncharacterized protein GBIM_16697 [Gryllus bimaculatus]|nr:Uncharacterized protein GBIM_16697 [Gryllus bimaculatus]